VFPVIVVIDKHGKEQTPSGTMDKRILEILSHELGYRPIPDDYHKGKNIIILSNLLRIYMQFKLRIIGRPIMLARLAQNSNKHSHT
jgi:hypothetical protein